MLDGERLILLDVMKVVLTTRFILSRQSFNQAHHFSVCYYMCIFLLLVQIYWLLYIFYFIGCKFGLG